MLFLKSPQFLSDYYEILTKKDIHEVLILTKLRNDLVKIVESGNYWHTVYVPQTPFKNAFQEATRLNL